MSRKKEQHRPATQRQIGEAFFIGIYDAEARKRGERTISGPGCAIHPELSESYRSGQDAHRTGYAKVDDLGAFAKFITHFSATGKPWTFDHRQGAMTI